MCGIVGTFYFRKQRSIQQNLQSSLDALKHRGPDDQGIYTDHHVSLGNTRLAICDRGTSGHMPMSNENKTVWITFNGEIFNYKELYLKLKRGHRIASKNDTELIVHLYEDYGIDIVHMLEGMFAFAIWDKTKQQLFVARDRIGKKPFKYYINDEFFTFASELKALFKNKLITKEIDYEALDQYLSYQYVPSPKTGFKGVYKLPPGHYMILDTNKKKKTVQYWKNSYETNNSLSEIEWKKKVNDSLVSAVVKRIPEEVSYGVHLSGGLDSSLIAAILAKKTKKLKTFSVKFYNSRNKDAEYARQISRFLKTEHYELQIGPEILSSLPEIVSSYEEPYADSSAIPTWHLSNFSKKHGITVAFNGDGADELFAGYERHLYAQHYQYFSLLSFLKPISKILRQFPKTLFHRISKAVTVDSLQSLYLESVNIFNNQEKEMIYTSKMMKLLNKDETFNSHFKSTTSLDNLHKILYMDTTTYLPECLLTKTDIGGMAHALEIRSPFLDENIISLASQIPSKYKIKGFEQKYILKRIAENYLPEEIIRRPKSGFGLPLEWLKNDCINYVYASLLDDKFLSYGLFSKNGIEKLLQNYYQKNHNLGNQIWSLLTFKEWLYQWFQ